MNLHAILRNAQKKGREILQKSSSNIARDSFEIFRNPDPEYKAWEEKTYAETTIQPLIEHEGIEDNAQICRFMNLQKFLDLVVNKRLLLPRLASLQIGDPHECVTAPDYTNKNHAELIEQIVELERYAPKPKMLFSAPTLFERVQNMSWADLRDAAWFLEYERLKRELACLCWYGKDFESDAMWKIYCQTLGVCITTTVSRLKANLSCKVPNVLGNDFKLTLKWVEYHEGFQVRHSLDSRLWSTPPWVIKRQAFSHEHELRMYVDYPLLIAPGFYVDIDPAKVITSIAITPYIKQWEADAVKDTIRCLFGAAHCPEIRQSAHMDKVGPSWPSEHLGPVISPPLL